MVLKSKLWPFLFGLSIGLTLAVYVTTYSKLVFPIATSIYTKRELVSYFPTEIPSSFDNYIPSINIEDDKSQHKDDDSVSRKLAKNVRILIWVMTSPTNLNVKAKAVKETWASHCELVLFFSSVDNDTFPAIGLNVSEGRSHLTAKTMKAFRYIYENHFNDADWFMKADDDTYVIIENLRYFLSGENSSEPVYFGQLFTTHVVQGYYSGGAGYVLSKEALRRFGEGAEKVNCSKDHGSEDVEMGFCMWKLGVRTGNTHDVLGRSRFHVFKPETHVNGRYMHWYSRYDAYGAKQGIESISDYAVSFHYVSPPHMYALEFFVYHLRPYGIMSELQILNNKTTVV
ncbi:glycoprotein-N-acetylgalactosamine 3-beta-galactosyltransferase 1-like [Physella acuta]|uniref:glycoprotein-N-acetylgalactosamine 3-beta-galactosyltransferase 1-like n=1 Tax=Physella acuta TaxID=109671 RepID=UPI0027DD682D|nr:glycoprotein-N-acetylgalactosamine 3-beta-galactosyltransferase 1-like [Physella acuta]